VATLAVLQLGNGLAGETTPAFGVGNSILCTLTLLDDVTQLALTPDTLPVATLTAPGPTTSALTVTSPSAGVYQAVAPLLLAGTYQVSFAGTTGAGAFAFVAVGNVTSSPLAVSSSVAPLPGGLIGYLTGTLVNGPNHNVPLTAAVMGLSGPTGAYSITGFALPGDLPALVGQQVVIQLSSPQPVTLSHLSVASTYPLKLAPGADLGPNTPPFGGYLTFRFFFDGVDWRQQ
jgi:hypothetical protein